MGNYQSVEEYAAYAGTIAYTQLQSNRNKQFPKEITHRSCVFGYFATQALSIDDSCFTDTCTESFIRQFPEFFQILQTFQTEVLIPWPQNSSAIVYIQPQYDQFSIYVRENFLAEVLELQHPEYREWLKPEQFHEGPFHVLFLDPFQTRPKVSESPKTQPQKPTPTKGPSKNKNMGPDRQGNAELVKEMNVQKSKQMEKSAEDREKSIKANKFHRRYKKTKRNVRV